MISAQEALELLREGNRHFVSGEGTRDVRESVELAELAEKQEPFAIILGCADSRVPAEIVFDMAFGDLFVVRVAGNIVAPTQVGSVEFAAQKFGTRLVVVLGHSRCGAVMAALEELRDPTEGLSVNLRSIVDRVRPSVQQILDTSPGQDEDDIIDRAVRANIGATAHELRHGSEVLRELIDEEGLRVVGAEYSLETGEVDFFDGLEDL